MLKLLESYYCFFLNLVLQYKVEIYYILCIYYAKLIKYCLEAN